MKEESLLLLSDLQKLINQVVLIDYTIIILGGEKSQPEGFQDHIQVGSFQEFGKIPPGEGKCHYFISFCGERIQGNKKQWDHKDNNCPDKVRNDQALKLFHQ